MKKVLFVVAHRPGRSPGQRFRFEQYVGYLEQKGFLCDLSFLLNEKDDKFFYSNGFYFRKFLILLKSIRHRFKDLKRAREYDIVFIYREAVMFGSAFFEKKFKKNGAKIILDFDDAIWLMDVSEGNKKLRWLKRPSKTADILKISDMAFVGNSYLAKYAGQYNGNVKIIPTTLDTEKTIVHKKESDKQVCIGWTGSNTTLKHFELAVPFLKKIQEKYPGKIRIKLISNVNHAEGSGISFCKWSKEKEIEDLSELDIGIMPLPDDDWARGKCGFKGLQYMALGIPAVMSPVGVNNEIISDGENGFLAGSDAEWVEKLSLLIESPELRKKIGDCGRKTVEEKYSFNAWKDEYVRLFEELITISNI
ncbi:MAG TPA: glycosyltransferase family 4 protein [Bacteroidales bacterium]|nr:glycosyltransferase family 4 protein [Bacteroidales bacterium]